ncbi:diacylglycerol/lipid kinase family protein [Tundrisphaera lichenicola]|uniref:diacylglycerol/lipid kinase family protein n=1 Tax=Tundrisphaera lichenicola TaxID=2029860 RepID=UPI003EBC21A1
MTQRSRAELAAGIDKGRHAESSGVASTRSGGWVGIAANPASGRGKGRVAVARLADELERLGVETRIAWTLVGRRELVDASTVPGDCRCLVAAGGDGTVAALINERPSVPIAVVPSGTENLFARHFDFKREPRRAAHRIVQGRSAWLDLGLAGDRRFALMAGFGFDADVVSRHHAARVGHSGLPRTTHRAAYVEPVLRSSFGYRFPLLTMKVEGSDGREETLAGTTAFVFNLPRYALGLPFAPRARGDDGWLDLVVFREPGAFRALHYLWLVVRGLHLDRPGIEHRKVRRVSIESAASVPVQLDGDPGGSVEPGSSTPWTIEVLPRAVEVVTMGVRSGRKGVAAH